MSEFLRFAVAQVYFASRNGLETLVLESTTIRVIAASCGAAASTIIYRGFKPAQDDAQPETSESATPSLEGEPLEDVEGAPLGTAALESPDIMRPVYLREMCAADVLDVIPRTLRLPTCDEYPSQISLHATPAEESCAIESIITTPIDDTLFPDSLDKPSTHHVSADFQRVGVFISFAFLAICMTCYALWKRSHRPTYSVHGPAIATSSTRNEDPQGAEDHVDDRDATGASHRGEGESDVQEDESDAQEEWANETRESPDVNLPATNLSPAPGVHAAEQTIREATGVRVGSLANVPVENEENARIQVAEDKRVERIDVAQAEQVDVALNAKADVALNAKADDALDRTGDAAPTQQVVVDPSQPAGHTPSALVQDEHARYAHHERLDAALDEKAGHTRGGQASPALGQPALDVPSEQAINALVLNVLNALGGQTFSVLADQGTKVPVDDDDDALGVQSVNGLGTGKPMDALDNQPADEHGQRYLGVPGRKVEVEADEDNADVPTLKKEVNVVRPINGDVSAAPEALAAPEANATPEALGTLDGRHVDTTAQGSQDSSDSQVGEPPAAGIDSAPAARAEGPHVEHTTDVGEGQATSAPDEQDEDAHVPAKTDSMDMAVERALDNRAPDIDASANGSIPATGQQRVQTAKEQTIGELKEQAMGLRDREREDDVDEAPEVPTEQLKKADAPVGSADDGVGDVRRMTDAVACAVHQTRDAAVGVVHQTRDAAVGAARTTADASTSTADARVHAAPTTSSVSIFAAPSTTSVSTHAFPNTTDASITASPTTADAATSTIREGYRDVGVQARPSTSSGGVQVRPRMASGGVQVHPATMSSGVQVRPAVGEGGVQVRPSTASGGVQAQPSAGVQLQPVMPPTTMSNAQLAPSAARPRSSSAPTTLTSTPSFNSILAEARDHLSTCAELSSLAARSGSAPAVVGLSSGLAWGLSSTSSSFVAGTSSAGVGPSNSIVSTSSAPPPRPAASYLGPSTSFLDDRLGGSGSIAGREIMSSSTMLILSIAAVATHKPTVDDEPAIDFPEQRTEDAPTLDEHVPDKEADSVLVKHVERVLVGVDVDDGDAGTKQVINGLEDQAGDASVEGTRAVESADEGAPDEQAPPNAPAAPVARMIGEQVEPVMNVPIRQADEGRVWSDLVSTTPQLSSPTHDVQVDNAPDGPVITAIVKESNDFLGEGPVDEPVERSEDVLASKNEILQAGIFTDALDEQAISAPDQQDFDAPTARDTMSPAKQVLSDHAVDIAARETPAHAVHIADSPGRRTADATAVEERVRKKSAAALIDRAIDVLEERSADAPVPRAEGRRLLDIDTPPATQDAPRERIHYKQKVDAFEIRATEVVHEEQVPGVSDRQNIDATATKVEGLPADHAVDDTFDVAGTTSAHFPASDHQASCGLQEHDISPLHKGTAQVPVSGDADPTKHTTHAPESAILASVIVVPAAHKEPATGAIEGKNNNVNNQPAVGASIEEAGDATDKQDIDALNGPSAEKSMPQGDDIPAEQTRQGHVADSAKPPSHESPPYHGEAVAVVKDVDVLDEHVNEARDENVEQEAKSEQERVESDRKDLRAAHIGHALDEPEDALFEEALNVLESQALNVILENFVDVLGVMGFGAPDQHHNHDNAPKEPTGHRDGQTLRDSAEGDAQTPRELNSAHDLLEPNNAPEAAENADSAPPEEALARNHDNAIPNRRTGAAERHEDDADNANVDKGEAAAPEDEADPDGNAHGDGLTRGVAGAIGEEDVTLQDDTGDKEMQTQGEAPHEDDPAPREKDLDAADSEAHVGNQAAEGASTSATGEAQADSDEQLTVARYEAPQVAPRQAAALAPTQDPIRVLEEAPPPAPPEVPAIAPARTRTAPVAAPHPPPAEAHPPLPVQVRVPAPAPVQHQPLGPHPLPEVRPPHPHPTPSIRQHSAPFERSTKTKRTPPAPAFDPAQGFAHSPSLDLAIVHEPVKVGVTGALPEPLFVFGLKLNYNDEGVDKAVAGEVNDEYAIIKASGPANIVVEGQGVVDKALEVSSAVAGQNDGARVLDGSQVQSALLPRQGAPPLDADDTVADQDERASGVEHSQGHVDGPVATGSGSSHNMSRELDTTSIALPSGPSTHPTSSSTSSTSSAEPDESESNLDEPVSVPAKIDRKGKGRATAPPEDEDISWPSFETVFAPSSEVNFQTIPSSVAEHDRRLKMQMQGDGARRASSSRRTTSTDDWENRRPAFSGVHAHAEDRSREGKVAKAARAATNTARRPRGR